jgi:fatty acid desaturase
VNLSAPLIGPEQTLTLLAILLAFVYIGLWADRQPWSSKFPGVLITILGPFLLATLGIIPHDAPLYKTFF